jgi:hypothetical protein
MFFVLFREMITVNYYTVIKTVRSVFDTTILFLEPILIDHIFGAIIFIITGPQQMMDTNQIKLYGGPCLYIITKAL